MRVLARRIWRYLKLFFYFKKINFLERLAYRGTFLFFMASVLIQISFNLFFLKIIFGRVQNLQGWNYYQILLIVGAVLILDGIMWMSVAYLHELKNKIRQGLLDGVLTKPVDSQFLASIYRGDLEDIVRIVMGISLLAFALSHLNLSWGFVLINSFWYLGLLFNGAVMLYSLAVAFNCIAFWTIEASMSFFLVESFVRSAQYPVDIFKKGAIRFLFTFIIPLAFWGTVPAKAFAGGLNVFWVLGSTVTALVFFLISRFVWKKGLAKYSSASS